ncbi:WAP four-disulfide core domain protein 2-like [Limulus polyphemus]|uniref:WAP four-disulfide core domain protein 2-like n=1 Tax=Limulus polyphemus TaxID=6850 RepID=A0ABM1SHU7_LIMPO|nr:WAP four-disulfide core domain protein 2-like [Limulus polyphemus]
MRVTVLFLIVILCGISGAQRLPFPFGPRRRVLPGQRGGGCVDCVAELRQCVQQCLEEHDCSASNSKEGFCPLGEVHQEKCSSSPVLDVCGDDNDCPRSKKCCKSGCSKVCVNPLPRPPVRTRKHRGQNNPPKLF